MQAWPSYRSAQEERKISPNRAKTMNYSLYKLGGVLKAGGDWLLIPVNVSTVQGMADIFLGLLIAL